MKKWIIIFTAMIIAVSLASCSGPDVDECVISANQMINDCDQYVDDAYGFFTDFSKDEMVYTIVTYVDEEEVARAVSEIETDYPNALRVFTISGLDKDEELISGYLTILKNAAESAFEGTKVKIVTCHMDTDGNIINYDL